MMEITNLLEKLDQVNTEIVHEARVNEILKALLTEKDIKTYLLDRLKELENE